MASYPAEQSIFRADTVMRRQLVSSLRVQSYTPEEIVERLTLVGCINPSTGAPWGVTVIKSDLKELTIQWQKQSRVAMTEHIGESLATLKELQKKAWEAEDLELVLKVEAQKIKLLGLSAPQAVSVTTDEVARELARLIGPGTSKDDLIRIAKALSEGEAP